MLIIPYQTRFSAKSLPAVTLALILVNAIVFFFLQSRDDSIYRAAFEHYAQSDLPGIELPRYRNWLLNRTDADALDRAAQLEQHGARGHRRVEADEQCVARARRRGEAGEALSL
ncbi:MAG: hypothetical protein N3D71_06230, partial [Burkholderiaceae bacterium]|nr:hypothetical protein [Burkholderiaceae bacterium]